MLKFGSRSSGLASYAGTSGVRTGISRVPLLFDVFFLPCQRWARPFGDGAGLLPFAWRRLFTFVRRVPCFVRRVPAGGAPIPWGKRRMHARNRTMNPASRKRERELPRKKDPFEFDKAKLVEMQIHCEFDGKVERWTVPPEFADVVGKINRE